jgi:hypothetical protein
LTFSAEFLPRVKDLAFPSKPPGLIRGV